MLNLALASFLALNTPVPLQAAAPPPPAAPHATDLPPNTTLPEPTATPQGAPAAAPMQPTATVAEQSPGSPLAIAPPPEDAATPQPEAGDIIVTGRARSLADPLAKLNAQSFAVTKAVDGAVMRPAAMAYKRTVPSPARDGLRNFLYNLREPIVFLNFMLQLKPGKGAETVARFAVNSTAGVGGVFDIAKRKPFKLPRRANGLADTLGYYGVKPGAYLYLPLIGPTTVRDLIGTTIERFALPFAIGGPFKNPAVVLPLGVLGSLDTRVEFDETLETLNKNTPDSYVATREFYLARRQAEIDGLRGKPARVVRPTAGSVKPTLIDPTAPPPSAPPETQSPLAEPPTSTPPESAPPAITPETPAPQAPVTPQTP